MSCPDPFAWLTSGPYQGATVTYIDTYNGYEVYYCTGPGGLYGALDPFTCTQVGSFSDFLGNIENYLWTLPYPTEPPPPEPPPEPVPEDVLLEQYRGVDIWQAVDSSFYFNVGGRRYSFPLDTFIEDIRLAIDNLLAEPPQQQNPMLWITLGLGALFVVTVLSGKKK